MKESTILVPAEVLNSGGTRKSLRERDSEAKNGRTMERRTNIKAMAKGNEKPPSS